MTPLLRMVSVPLAVALPVLRTVTRIVLALGKKQRMLSDTSGCGMGVADGVKVGVAVLVGKIIIMNSGVGVLLGVLVGVLLGVCDGMLVGVSPGRTHCAPDEALTSCCTPPTEMIAVFGPGSVFVKKIAMPSSTP